MFIVERLTSRSSVALSVSIGYARTGGGRGSAMRSRSPDDDARDHFVRHRCFPSRTFVQVPIAAVRGMRNEVWFPRTGIPAGGIAAVVS